MKGKFLVLEGMDGSGKSTQAEALCRWLEASGHGVLHVREPGTTVVGEALRDLLLDPCRDSWDSRTESLLFFAARRELLNQLVVPALLEGRHVICERFTPSTVAYQGHEEGMIDFILDIDANLIQPEEQPHLAVILDLTPESAFDRARSRGEADGMEQRGLDFQRKVREGYLSYASSRPDTTILVDVEGLSPADVTDRIRSAVEDLFI